MYSSAHSHSHSHPQPLAVSSPSSRGRSDLHLSSSPTHDDRFDSPYSTSQDSSSPRSLSLVFGCLPFESFDILSKSLDHDGSDTPSSHSHPPLVNRLVALQECQRAMERVFSSLSLRSPIVRSFSSSSQLLELIRFFCSLLKDPNDEILESALKALNYLIRSFAGLLESGIDTGMDSTESGSGSGSDDESLDSSDLLAQLQAQFRQLSTVLFPALFDVLVQSSSLSSDVVRVLCLFLRVSPVSGWLGFLLASLAHEQGLIRSTSIELLMFALLFHRSHSPASITLDSFSSRLVQSLILCWDDPNSLVALRSQQALQILHTRLGWTKLTQLLNQCQASQTQVSTIKKPKVQYSIALKSAGDGVLIRPVTSKLRNSNSPSPPAQQAAAPAVERKESRSRYERERERDDNEYENDFEPDSDDHDHDAEADEHDPEPDRSRSNEAAESHSQNSNSHSQTNQLHSFSSRSSSSRFVSFEDPPSTRLTQSRSLLNRIPSENSRPQSPKPLTAAPPQAASVQPLPQPLSSSAGPVHGRRAMASTSLNNSPSPRSMSRPGPSSSQVPPISHYPATPSPKFVHLPSTTAALNSSSAFLTSLNDDLESARGTDRSRYSVAHSSVSSLSEFSSAEEVHPGNHYSEFSPPSPTSSRAESNPSPFNLPDLPSVPSISQTTQSARLADRVPPPIEITTGQSMVRPQQSPASGDIASKLRALKLKNRSSSAAGRDKIPSGRAVSAYVRRAPSEWYATNEEEAEAATPGPNQERDQTPRHFRSGTETDVRRSSRIDSSHFFENEPSSGRDPVNSSISPVPLNTAEFDSAESAPAAPLSATARSRPQPPSPSMNPSSRLRSSSSFQAPPALNTSSSSNSTASSASAALPPQAQTPKGIPNNAAAAAQKTRTVRAQSVAINSIQVPGTPGGSSSGPSASDDGNMYLSSAELQPLDNPSEGLKYVLKNLKSQDWSQRFEALNFMRRLSVNHSDTLSPQLRSLLRDVKTEVDSLRSSLARNALMSLTDFLQNQSKIMENELDSFIMNVLKRSGESSGFLAEEANKALEYMCRYCNELKTMNALLNQATTGSKVIKNQSIVFIDKVLEYHAHRIFQQAVQSGQVAAIMAGSAAPGAATAAPLPPAQAGSKAALLDFARLLRSLVSFSGEAAVSSRQAAKLSLLRIQKVSGGVDTFEKLLSKILTPTQFQGLKKLLDKERMGSIAMPSSGKESPLPEEAMGEEFSHLITRYSASKQKRPVAGTPQQPAPVSRIQSAATGRSLPSGGSFSSAAFPSFPQSVNTSIGMGTVNAGAAIVGLSRNSASASYKK